MSDDPGAAGAKAAPSIRNSLRAAMAVFTLVASASNAWADIGQFQVRVAPASEVSAGLCEMPYDGMRLTVLKGASILATETYCSSYGKGDARLVSDARGRNFIFVDYAVGHGTNAGSDWLAVYQIADRLVERARVNLSAPAGSASRWRYEYGIEKPETGGLQLLMVRYVDGRPDNMSDLPKPSAVVDVNPAG